MTSLRCPNCDYVLRGIARDGDVLQCPECGTVTDLTSIARTVVERRRRTRTAQHEITIVLAGAGVTVLAAILFDGGPVLAAFRNRLGFLLSGTGVAITAVASVVLFLLSTARWPELLRSERATFAVVTALMFVLAPLPIGLVPIALWLAGFSVWAGRDP